MAWTRSHGWWWNLSGFWRQQCPRERYTFSGRSSTRSQAIELGREMSTGHVAKVVVVSELTEPTVEIEVEINEE